MNQLAFYTAILAGLSWSTLLLASPSNSTETGFFRIIHGWTNYSTAFNATHDPDPAAGDYVAVATFHSPDKYVRPTNYGVIVIWRGDTGQHLDFSTFSFQVDFWTSLESFAYRPTAGDLATIRCAAPTGGSTTVRDATTRGGRAAYYITFNLGTNMPVLAPGQTCLVGFSAATDTTLNGELFVPTANSAGQSDVQAGDLIAGGWQHLIQRGGSTIYCGELATELLVQPVSPPPQLQVWLRAGAIQVSWPDTTLSLKLQSADACSPGADWKAVSPMPEREGSVWRVLLPVTFDAQFYRLVLP